MPGTYRSTGVALWGRWRKHFWKRVIRLVLLVLVFVGAILTDRFQGEINDWLDANKVPRPVSFAFTLLGDYPWLVVLLPLGYIALTVERARRELSGADDATEPVHVTPGLTRKLFRREGVWSSGRVHKSEWLSDVAVLHVRSWAPGEAYFIATINFTDCDGKRLTVQGRWGDTPLPEHPDRAVETLRFMRGELHALDIALRAPDTKRSYALDNTTPFHFYRRDDYVLSAPIAVQVLLLGTTDWEVTLTLSENEDGTPSVTLLDSHRQGAGTAGSTQ